MARNLLTLTISAPTSDPAQDEGGNFTFTVTPGFAGGGGVTAYDLDLQWDQGTATWQTIPGSGGLSTAGTAYYASTTQDTAFTITVDCNTAGSYNIRAINTSRSITSTPTSQAVTVNSAGNTETPLLADPSPTITGYAPTASINTPITVGTAPLQFVYVIGLKLEGQPLSIDVSGGGDNPELPLLGELDLAGIIPTTVVANNVSPGLDTLALSGVAPTAVVGNVVLPGLDTLVLGEQTPDPIQGQVEQPLLGTLALGIAGSAPDAVIANVREPATDTLSLGVVGSDPTASVGELREPATIGLSLDGKVPTLGAYDIPEAPGLGTLAFASDVVTVVHDRLSDALLDTLSLDGKIPITSVGDLREPPIDELALASDVVTVGHNRVADVPLGSLSLSGKTPTGAATIEPATVGLSLDGKVPLIGGVGIEVPTGGLNIYQYIGLKLDTFPPSISLADTVSPSTIGLSLSGSTADLNVTVLPSTASLDFSGIIPTVSGTVSPGTGALVLQGYETADQDAIVVPVGSLTLSGIAPSLKGIAQPSTASLTIDEQTPTVDYVAAPTPDTDPLVLSGIAPTVVQGQIELPLLSSLTLSGKIPLAPVDTAGSSTRTPLEGSMTYAGQSVTIKIVIDQLVPSDSLVLSGKAPTTEINKIIVVPTGDLTLISRGRLSGTGSLSLTGQPVTIWYRDGTLIENPNADDSIISNIEECDYSGFKVMPGSLKMTWNRYAVRQKSYEDRHPSDVPHRTYTQRKRGPQRPEPDDNFVTGDIDPGEDL